LTVLSRRLRVSRACVAACFLLLVPGLAAAAVAQILPPGRPGLPSGPFLLFPSVSFEASHDSNVLYRSSDLSEDIVGSDIVLLRPRIMVELPIGRNRFRLAYSPQYRDYSSDRFQQAKRISHFFDLEASLKLGPSVTCVVRDHMFRGSIEVDQVDRGGELTFGQIPFVIQSVGAEIGLELGARQGISVLPSYESVRFEEAGEQRLFSYRRRGFEGRYNFRLSEPTTLYVFSSYEGTQQDREQLIFGQVEAASHKEGVGLRRVVNQSVMTQISAGYQNLKFVGGTGSRFSGLGLDGTINVRLGELASLDISALRQPLQSFFINNNYYVAEQLRLALRHQVTRGMLYMAAVTYYRNDYPDPLDIRVTSETPAGEDQNPANGFIDDFEAFLPSQGIERRDSGIRLEAGVGYQFGPNMRAFFGYNQERRDSNILEVISGSLVSPFDYRVNRLSLRFEVGWL
jgi:hypothetical protein